MAFDPLTAIFDVAGKIIDRVIPDKVAAQKAKDELAKEETKNEFSLMLGQMQINMEEAKSINWFVAGWRPYIGWICGTALLYVALLEPFIRFIAVVIFSYQGKFPVIDTTITMQVLLGMLGLGGLRTYEKTRNGAKGVK